jgi:predicted dehydrogenase
MAHKINIGMVGCGAYAQIAYLPALKKNPHCDLVAICDSDVRKIDHLGAKYHVPNRYQDFQDIVTQSDIHALIIATPNYLHAPMTIAALKYGKHVLCEHPMATNYREAREMVKVAKQTGQKLSIALNNRLRPDVEILKKFINEGELGDIYYTKAGWLIGSREWILKPWRVEQLKSGGGAFLSLGIHLLDITLYFLQNKKPASIFGSIHKKDPEAEVEDTAMCVIDFTDGTLLSIEVSWSLLFEKDFLYCNVFGKKGAALLNPLRIQKELHRELVNVTPTLSKKNIYKASYEQQVQTFIDHLNKNQPMPVTPKNGLFFAKISDAFYESAHKHALVKIKAL